MTFNKQRGFAGLLANIMMPLNDNPKFKDKFKNTNRKVLINPTNLNYAALLIIDNSKLQIESIPNKPKSNLNRNSIGWDAYISMDTQLFLSLAMKRLTMLKLSLKIISGKIKIKGILKLLSMLKLIKILTE
ncbi:MAG: hypothetical protein ACFFBH_11540 [Promethearchaeota archaeon]